MRPTQNGRTSNFILADLLLDNIRYLAGLFARRTGYHNKKADNQGYDHESFTGRRS
jgi:hypothetical protein